MAIKGLCIFVSLLSISLARTINYEDVEELHLLGDLIQVEPRIFESKIVEAINKFKYLLKNGDAANGVPAMDPYFLREQKFDFILDDTMLEGYFQNVIFSNFSDFEVCKVEFKLLPLHFKVNIFLKEFNMKGIYKMVGNIFDNIEINGTGYFISDTNNMNLSLYLRPMKVNSTLQIKDLIFEFSALYQKISYTNEYEGSECKVLDENTALHILDQIQERYVTPLLETAKMVLNHFLLGYSYEEIIKMIFNFISVLTFNGGTAMYLQDYKLYSYIVKYL